jgi:chromatin remodeling complex protein RSC6
MARFDKFNAEQNSAPSADDSPVPSDVKASNSKRKTPEPSQQASPPTSGTRNEDDDEDEDSFEPVEPPVKPAKKKVKRDPADEDARYAARLQAEENSRARATRGAPSRKTTGVVKKKKKVVRKSGSKRKSEDVSDGDSASGLERKKEVNRSGGFHKPMALSTPLATFLGETMVRSVLGSKQPITTLTKSSSLVHRLSRRYGSMSKSASCRIRTIGG